MLLTHCILVDSSTVICWKSPFIILGMSGLFYCFYFDLGLHCLPMTGFQVRMGLRELKGLR